MKLPALAYCWQASGLQHRLAGLRGSVVRTFSAMELPDPRAGGLAYRVAFFVFGVRLAAAMRMVQKRWRVLGRACLGATNIRFNARENTRSKAEPQ